MRLETKKYLLDIQQAAARISDYRRIIAFRNILIHGYRMDAKRAKPTSFTS